MLTLSQPASRLRRLSHPGGAPPLRQIGVGPNNKRAARNALDCRAF